MNRREETAEAEKELLEIRRHTLGEDDQLTISTAHNLSITLNALNRLEEAVELCEEVVEKRRRLLGENHSDTQKSIRMLQQLRRKMDESGSQV